MIISRIILKNWKNFKHVDVNLGSRIFLIGPNASGKSNFLDVFRFLRDIVIPGGGLQKAISDRGGISKIRCLAARQSPDIEIEIHFSDTEHGKTTWVYALGIKQQSRGFRKTIVSYERIFQNGTQILDRPNDSDKDDVERLTQTHLEQISANFNFRDISNFFKAVNYQHLVPQLVKNPVAYQGQGLDNDPFGLKFLEKISRTTERTRNARLHKIQIALQIAVPQLKDLKYQMDSTGIPHLQANYNHWRPYGAYQQEDQFSDGTIRLIGLLWALLEGDTLLLLEEPELSLNTAIVEKIPGIISQLLNSRKKNSQIFISTHSSDILSDKGIGGKEVLLLDPTTNGTQVILAASKATVNDLLRNGFSIAEAVLPMTKPNNLEQLSFFNGE